eukprot:3232028-Alexandrium_andersonii.AAC.1
MSGGIRPPRRSGADLAKAASTRLPAKPATRSQQHRRPQHLSHTVGGREKAMQAAVVRAALLNHAPA